MSTPTENFDSFQYVVEQVKAAPICFGSTVPRNTNPIGDGLSPFQKKLTHEIFSKTGPGHYFIENYTSSIYQQLNKVRSTKGIGAMVGNFQRFKQKFVKNPSPCTYDVEYKWGADKNKTPFNSTSVEKSIILNDHPGPGTYDLNAKKCRRTRFKYNWGHPRMIQAVETICLEVPVDTCHKCKTLCKGDYWHKDMSLFLCHLCWMEEKATHEIYNEKQLKQYIKIRNCSYMHDHQDTKAAIRILPENKIKKKMRLENYLDLYIKC